MQNHLIKRLVCTCLFACILSAAFAQDNSISALKAQFKAHPGDTSGVKLLSKLSMQIQSSRPDSALFYARLGLNLAQKIGYKKGEGLCLNRLGVVLWKNGKYDQALLSLIDALKVREEINDQVGELGTLNNIGIIYSDQNDNVKALSYHFKAKALAESLDDKKGMSVVCSNIGNCYIKLHKIDSALNYEMQSYEIQHEIGDKQISPNTLSILGDINYEMGHKPLALDYYRLSAVAAIKTDDQSDLADTYNSVATLYKNTGNADSAAVYATRALDASAKGMYPEGIYKASNLLMLYYQGKNEHLELLYLKQSMAAKDSMFNAEKVKQLQALSFAEAARQQEILEEKHKEAENRIINLQLIAIALFIPAFFVVLLLLSKSRTHRKVIEFMSVLSLLLAFEFISLFIHPFVQRISSHLPVLELTISVCLASILVPLHHNLTHWLREKLAHAAHPHMEKHEGHHPVAPKEPGEPAALTPDQPEPDQA